MLAILCITIIAVMVILVVPSVTEIVAGSAITGIGMLGMKLLEGE